MFFGHNIASWVENINMFRFPKIGLPQIIYFWQDFPNKNPPYEATQLQLPREKYHDPYYKVVPQFVS